MRNCFFIVFPCCENWCYSTEKTWHSFFIIIFYKFFQKFLLRIIYHVNYGPHKYHVNQFFILNMAKYKHTLKHSKFQQLHQLILVTRVPWADLHKLQLLLLLPLMLINLNFLKFIKKIHTKVAFWISANLNFPERNRRDVINEKIELPVNARIVFKTKCYFVLTININY